MFLIKTWWEEVISKTFKNVGLVFFFSVTVCNSVLRRSWQTFSRYILLKYLFLNRLWCVSESWKQLSCQPDIKFASAPNLCCEIALKHLLLHNITQCWMYAMEIYNSDILPCIYLFQEAKDDSGCIVCPLCDKGFQTQHQLTMHIRQVTCTPNSFVQYTVAYLLIFLGLYASQQRWHKVKYHLSKYFQNTLRQTTWEN